MNPGRLASRARVRQACSQRFLSVADFRQSARDGGMMTNNCVSTVFGVLGVLAALTFPVTPGKAAEAQTALGGKLVVCGVCHGVNGSPKLEGVPIIWGLQENYILKQLHEFQHGERASDTMKKI